MAYRTVVLNNKVYVEAIGLLAHATGCTRKSAGGRYASLLNRNVIPAADSTRHKFGGSSSSSPVCTVPVAICIVNQLAKSPQRGKPPSITTSKKDALIAELHRLAPREATADRAWVSQVPPPTAKWVDGVYVVDAAAFWKHVCNGVDMFGAPTVANFSRQDASCALARSRHPNAMLYRQTKSNAFNALFTPPTPSPVKAPGKRPMDPGDELDAQIALEEKRLKLQQARAAVAMHETQAQLDRYRKIALEGNLDIENDPVEKAKFCAYARGLLPSGLELTVDSVAATLRISPAVFKRHGSAMGKRAAELYFARHGTRPHKQQRLVHGTLQNVYVYSAQDEPILREAIESIESSI